MTSRGGEHASTYFPAAPAATVLPAMVTAAMENDPRALSTYRAGRYSLQFRKNSFDRFIIEEIWEHGEYFLEQLGDSSAGWIIDVGAHIGAFAVKAHAAFPGQPVLALEPVADNFQLLEQNLARNECRTVIPLNMAVMGERGTTEVYLDPVNTAGHSTVLRTTTATVTTEAVRLDDLFDRFHVDRIGLLKIDCEGAEYQILLTPCFRSVSARIFNVVFEYHPVEGYDFEQLRRVLESTGFVFTAHKDGYLPGQGTALFQRSVS